MAKKKYLSKNEFRYYNNPKFLSKNGRPHPAYISARYKHKYKFNVITHSRKFFDEGTTNLEKNPELQSTDKRTSRVSVPRWDNVNQFGDKLPKWYWRFTKKDKAKVKKVNRKNKPKNV